jgi:phosphopantothenoylcysteine synthetase/decarboxylase
VVEPDTGAHACGDDGGGRLPEPEALVARIEALLAQGTV